MDNGTEQPVGIGEEDLRPTMVRQWLGKNDED